ncbi:MAG: MATE family efflux transporter, partial [Clostridiales bacterium]|nr:MATE family efflux transporter [Clostridiales bacterium]
FVGVVGMGAKGAATATVMAQALSVVISLLFIRKMALPFTFQLKQIKPVKAIVGSVVRIGFPLALQDFLVSISFLIILAIVNSMGLIASAGMGVGVKVCSFIMLVPSAFSQAMSAFVAQNYGAGKMDRAGRALKCAIGISVVAGVIMFYVAFFHGGQLSTIFTNEADVIAQAADYLKAYGIDCLLTCFLFCMIGYFNGMGATKFVAIQSLVGAFCVRIPVALIMSRQSFANLFFIGLATPCSTVVQITLSFICLAYIRHKWDIFKRPTGEITG